MTSDKAAYFRRAALFLLLVLVLGVQLTFLWQQGRDVFDLWFGFAMLLALLGGVVLLAGRKAAGVGPLAGVLLALSVTFGEVAAVAYDIRGVPPWLEEELPFLMYALALLFPSAFVHFSLVFPVTAPWFGRQPKRALGVIYLPYATGLVLLALLSPGEIDPGGYDILAGLAGFLVGLAIFARHYRHSLTVSEKNRLRLILAGCLAGFVPLILTQSDTVPWLEGIALPLLPLFPLSLVVAVLAQDLGESKVLVRQVVLAGLIGAGVIVSFFVWYLVLWLLFGLPPEQLWFWSLAIAVMLAYPLVRACASYAAAHFPLPARACSTTVPPTFKPISPNPYIVGNPVRTSEMFFGRHQDFEFVRSRLQGQRHGCVIFLCGERRAGKTSLLYQVLNGRLGSGFIPVFIDLQEMVVQADSEFISLLRDKIALALVTTLPAVQHPATTEVDNYRALSAFVDEIMPLLSGARLVLLFDEYELLEEKVRDGKIRPEVFSYLNGLLERHPHLSIVLTGSRSLRSSATPHSLLAKSSYREISFLSPIDAQELICLPLEGRAAFTSEAVRRIFTLTRGHPFYTQLICQTVVEVLNEAHSNTAGTETIEQSLRRVLEHPPPQLLYQWSGFEWTEKLVLAACATLVKQPGGQVSASRVERLIATLPEGYQEMLGSGVVRMTLESLRADSLLDRDQDRYRFVMDLFRVYVRNEHNVWDVLSQVSQTPVH